jgi:Spy/CpxP family protein refolding chaperone
LKTIRLFALIAALSTLCAAEPSTAPTAPADPLAGAFYPPEVILMSHAQIGLTQEQQDDIRARVQKVQSRTEELRQRLEHETAALASLARQDKVDEAAVAAQLDRVLDVEREVKHLHIGLLAGIKNLLTPEQRVKLRQIAGDGGAQFAEDMRRRLTEKVERVKQGAQAWESSGRDTSGIARAMQEKVKPLLDSGQPVEAEAELDRLLEQLNQGAK